MRGIADTGFLVAFANRADEHHDWAVSVAEQVTDPLLTCEPVLAEASFHLQDVALVLAMIQERLIRLSFDCNDHLPQLEVLAARYADRHPDLADLCLVRMSELFPKHSVITVDREDFRIYRRNKRGDSSDLPAWSSIAATKKNSPQRRSFCLYVPSGCRSLQLLGSGMLCYLR